MSKCVTDEYPDGYAAMPWEALMNDLGNKSADDKRRLKEKFKTDEMLSLNKNPAKMVKKLQRKQKFLQSKYQYVK